MRLGYYISEHFIQELSLDPSSDVARKLMRIRRNILIFLALNTVVCYYAFYSLFALWPVALLATALFQFIFLMIYVVLFSTVRKAEYLLGAVNRKVKGEAQIGAHVYAVSKFELKDELQNNTTRKSWKNIIIRSLMLLLLGVGPAFFFAIMLHHPFLESQYESAKRKYVDEKIANYQKIRTASLAKVKLETDSLLRIQKELKVQLEESITNPDPLDYRQEDRQWASEKLEAFNNQHEGRIKRNQERLMNDSIAGLNFQLSMTEYFANSNFFQIRAGVIWHQAPLTYSLFFLLYLFMLLLPFISRYRLMIKQPEVLDDLLEQKYVKIINDDHQRTKSRLLESHAAKELRSAVESFQAYPEYAVKVNEWNFLYSGLQEYGSNYEDPAFKVRQKPDTRIFVEKQNLGKHLGEL